MSDSFFSAYQPLVQQAWQECTKQVSEYDSALSPMLSHHFQVSGKLLRPMLTVAFYDRLQGTSTLLTPDKRPDAVIQTALAIELLHNGTLIHDDLQDGDETRRGHPTVWKKFSAYQAINAGSTLYFHAQARLLQLDIPATTQLRLSQLLAEQALAIVAGQAAEKNLHLQLDPNHSTATTNHPNSTQTDDSTSKEKDFRQARALYLDVVEKKTSALFALPLVSAAILAGEPQAVTQGLLAVAQPLGALFQIQDDILDLYGEKGRDTAGNDIAEGKPSLLALHFLHHAPTPLAQQLRTTLLTPREETTPDQITWAIQQIREHGSLSYCLQQVHDLHTQALTHFETLPFHRPHPGLREFLEATIQKLLQPVTHITA